MVALVQAVCETRENTFYTMLMAVESFDFQSISSSLWDMTSKVVPMTSSVASGKRTSTQYPSRR